LKKMFNLSPQDIVGLQEAYQSVYLQEDVEQLDELTGGQIAAAVGGPVGYLGYKAVKGFAQGLTGGGDKPAAKPAAPTQSRFAGARDAAFKKAQAIKGSPVVGAKPAPTAAKPAAKPSPTPAATKPSPTAAAKPAAAKPSPTPAATKPSPTAAAKPAPTTSTASAAKPSAMDQWAKANPRLAQAQKIRQQGGSRAEVNKALYNKGTAAATSTPTVVKAGVDLFDIIKGHLLDEGFADTEEAALAIMTNMSDEWRNEILDELYKGKHGQSETEYMAGRSDAGKRISGDEKEGPASYASRWHKGSEPTKPGQKPKNVQKLSKSEKEEIAYRKANLKKEETELDEALTGERYKKVMKKPGGTAYSRKVSADPDKRATRGGKGGESDFGAGDRGSGNKARRRAGTYQEYDVNEATYSAKEARAGKDIGKPGKAFAKIAKSAAKRYGSKERGEKVAGAILAKLRAKRG
jgi:hypothetical protein